MKPHLRANSWSRLWIRIYNTHRKFFWTIQTLQIRDFLELIMICWFLTSLELFKAMLNYSMINHHYFVRFEWNVVPSREIGLNWRAPAAVWEASIRFNILRIVARRLKHESVCNIFLDWLSWMDRVWFNFCKRTWLYSEVMNSYWETLA